MITELELAYFKAFGNNQSIPLRPITLIFGANSSGKSSLLHALLLAHHGVSTGEFNVTTPILGGDTVDLGGFRQFVFKKDRKLHSKIGCSLDNVVLETKWLSPLLHQESFPVSIKVVFEIGDSYSEATLVKYQLWLNDQPFFTFLTEGFYFSLDYINVDHPYFEGRLTHIRKRLFGNEMPFWRLKEALSGLKEAYHFKNQEIVTDFDSGMSYTPRDEGERVESEVLYTSLLAAASYEDPELEEIFEELDESFRVSPYDFVWLEDNNSAFPEQSRSRLKKVFALATDLENSIFREVRLHEMLRLLNGAVQKEFRKVSYLGPLRALPKRVVEDTDVKNTNWQATGEFAWNAVLNDMNVQQAVNAWLSADFLNTKYELNTHIALNAETLNLFLEKVSSEIDHRFKWIKSMVDEDSLEQGDLIFDSDEFVKEVWSAFRHAWEYDAVLSEATKELILTDLRTDTRVSHRDVGIGISQILPVLVHAFASNQRLIAVEQPELHLHPALQAELGDVFIRSALGDSSNQVVLETHSEHLILRLMRRIRETCNGTLPEGIPPVTSKDVAILFVEPTAKGSIVRQIKLDDEGQLIDAWPGGFFEEGFRERFA